MPGRIVLYGATGYTGALTAQAMIARGARPVPWRAVTRAG